MHCNPAGLVFVLGKNPRLCDDGIEVSNWAMILYQCSSPQESESTNLKIHVDKDFPDDPSAILEYSYDSVNTSLLNDFTEILALFDAEQDLHNEGNPNYKNLGGHLQESEGIFNSLIASHGTFGTGKQTSVYLRLPGELTCNNKSWQGETYEDKSIKVDGYLKKYHMTSDIPLSEITAGWDIDTTTIPIVSPATEATGGTRYYIMWYFPVSGGTGKRIAAKVAPVFVKLYEVFVKEDATLVEVNPLILSKSGEIIALDGKVSLDDNAEFRHEREEMERDQLDPLEAKAKEMDLNYVKLDGEVGIIGNGAGLVMSTLDVVAYAGERHGNVKPANFLDIGGGASAEVMAAGLDVILNDPQVRSVFVNVFGGITACDAVANGIVGALNTLGDRASKPLVVRLDGNNVEEGRRILSEFNHPLVSLAETMDGGADKAAQLANK